MNQKHFSQGQTKILSNGAEADFISEICVQMAGKFGAPKTLLTSLSLVTSYRHDVFKETKLTCQL